MKLLRQGIRGQEKPTLIDANGNIRDLSGVISDISTDILSPQGLAELAKIDPESLAIVEKQRPGVPWAGMGKFIAVGLNYIDHVKESGATIPNEPVMFMKATDCVVGALDPVVLPQKSVKSDWEVELGVVIGQRARYVSQAEALDYVAGYCVVNDISEREYQLERGGQWDKGKSCPTFGPVGPLLVTKDEIDNVQNLNLWLDVNGQKMQRGNSANMIFTVAEIVSYLSQFVSLNPGDLISTGTPPGVGMGQQPQPIYLKAGDIITLGIDQLGQQQQQVYSWNEELIDLREQTIPC